MLKPADKRALEEYAELCKAIANATPVQPEEPLSEKLARIARAKTDYGFFFEYYMANYAKSKCAKWHIDFANRVKKDRTFKGILEAHRGAAKSVHVDTGIPLWLLFQDELKCMMLVGQTEKKAQRLLGSLQAQLTSNQRIINDFGEQAVFGDWAEGEFITKTGAAFFALGMGQSPNGTRNEANRPDYIACDDLDNKKLCKNPSLLADAVSWIEEDLMGCFDIGTERFVFTNSRIAKDSILTRLIKKMVTERKADQRWYHLQINALDKKGNPTWPEKYTKAYWEKKRKSLTLTAWNANYMNNPITEGKVFKEQWIKWKPVLPLRKYDHLVVYGDPSYKSTPGADHKAVKFWGKIGRELHLIKAFVRQCSMNEMVKFFYDLHESFPENVTVDYYMEDAVLQDLLFDEFTYEGDVRGYQLPIRPDSRKKPDKFSRIEATAPLYTRGFIIYNEAEKEDPDMNTAKEHLLAFEKGCSTPVDSPDADEGAIHILQKQGREDNFTPVIGQRPKAKNGY